MARQHIFKNRDRKRPPTFSVSSLTDRINFSKPVRTVQPRTHARRRAFRSATKRNEALGAEMSARYRAFPRIEVRRSEYISPAVEGVDPIFHKEIFIFYLCSEDCLSRLCKRIHTDSCSPASPPRHPAFSDEGV